MSLIGNILWLLLGGIFTAFGYVVTGVGLCITIIGIPFGFQCFKLALLCLFPFGKEVVPVKSFEGPVAIIFNVLWIIYGGVWIAVTHLTFAFVCAITVIGIPFALQHMKLASLSLMPFGKEIR